MVIPGLTGSATMAQKVAADLRAKVIDLPGLLDSPEDPVHDLGGLSRALTTLQEAPADQLEWAFRSVLDVYATRLDAWITSLATAQLHQQRAAQAGGLHIGGWGLVEDLRPDRGRAAESLGYVHTPSLGQAASTAVLRSARAAHRDAQGRIFDLDLSSQRVRHALTILEGVAQGQRLAALLGYRFERALHESGNGSPAQWIPALRRLFPLRSDRPDDPTSPAHDPGLGAKRRRPAGGVGSRTRRRRRGGPARAVRARRGRPVGHRGDRRRGAGGRRRGGPRSVADLADAVSDVLVAEAVHQATSGNLERSGAALAAHDQQGPPPDPEFVRTPRSGHAVAHRVGIWLPAADLGAAPGWTSDLRTIAEPRLDHWIGALLGDPHRWSIRGTAATGSRRGCASTRPGRPGQRQPSRSRHERTERGPGSAPPRTRTAQCAGGAAAAAALARAERRTSCSRPPTKWCWMPMTSPACSTWPAGLPTWPAPAPCSPPTWPLSDDVVAPSASWPAQSMRSDALDRAVALTAAVTQRLAALRQAHGRACRGTVGGDRLGGGSSHPCVAGPAGAPMPQLMTATQGAELPPSSAPWRRPWRPWRRWIPPQAAPADGTQPAEDPQVVHARSIVHLLLGTDQPFLPVVRPADPPPRPPRWRTGTRCSARTGHRHGRVAAPNGVGATAARWPHRPAHRGRGPWRREVAEDLRLVQAPHRPGRPWVALPFGEAGPPEHGTVAVLLHTPGGIEPAVRRRRCHRRRLDRDHSGDPRHDSRHVPLRRPGRSGSADDAAGRPPRPARTWSLQDLAGCVSEAADLARLRTLSSKELAPLSTLLPALFLPDGYTRDTPGVRIMELLATSGEPRHRRTGPRPCAGQGRDRQCLSCATGARSPRSSRPI